MKYLVILFAFLIVNSIYSQPTACGAGYSFASTNPATCNYVFTPSFPTGHQCIAYLFWLIGSSGTYGRQCERLVTDTLGLSYEFCFYGNQNVQMFVKFCDSSSCYTAVSTINVSCSGALLCDPDPTDPEYHPCPVVEISYVDPYICATGAGSGVSGCMNALSGGLYTVSCGWTWAFKIPISPYNCDPFTYWIQYDSLHSTSDCNSTCVSHALTPGTTYCKNAKVDETIYIVADGNHCCLPAGYRRAYIWTPTTSTYTAISDPTSEVGICTDRCGGAGTCTEDEQQMCETAGWPDTRCFRGGGNKVEKRVYSVLAENAGIEQNVIIYNLQGAEIFNGKWIFGNPNNLFLNWPENVGLGLYLVKFQNSEKLVKLFKFN